MSNQTGHNSKPLWKSFLFYGLPLIILIGLAAYYATGGKKVAPVASSNQEFEVAKRLQRVGTVELAEPKAAAGGAMDGETLYKNACAACHAAGAMGAPKFGDKASWAARVGAGIDGLTASAIKGKNSMPPRGGTSASDDEIKAAVTYMFKAAK